MSAWVLQDSAGFSELLSPETERNVVDTLVAESLEEEREQRLRSDGHEPPGDVD